MLTQTPSMKQIPTVKWSNTHNDTNKLTNIDSQRRSEQIHNEKTNIYSHNENLTSKKRLRL